MATENTQESMQIVNNEPEEDDKFSKEYCKNLEKVYKTTFNRYRELLNDYVKLKKEYNELSKKNKDLKKKNKKSDAYIHKLLKSMKKTKTIVDTLINLSQGAMKRSYSNLL